ncbi:MAG: hypothetical protein KBD16_00550 [Candidatus Pacebacteria bacterium]|nr:hypothetical protein [Candidatus Paceibacterota bacterium]
MNYFFAALTLFLGLYSLANAQVNVTDVSVTTNIPLLWETETYVPPFYKGKALLPDGGDVRVLALPPANLGDPSALSYTWKVDGVVVDTASGFGRTFFIARSDIFGGSKLIVVEVKRGDSRVGTGAIRVPLVEPSALIYPSLPLAGILFGGGTRAVASDEITFEAYPLFFSVPKKQTSDLVYEWSINREYVSNPLGNSGRLTLRKDAGGSAAVSISLHNQARVLETADASIEVVFEE